MKNYYAFILETKRGKRNDQEINGIGRKIWDIPDDPLIPIKNRKNTWYYITTQAENKRLLNYLKRFKTTWVHDGIWYMKDVPRLPVFLCVDYNNTMMYGNIGNYNKERWFQRMTGQIDFQDDDIEINI